MAHASLVSNKPTVELDQHADTWVVGDSCLVIHDHNRPIISTVTLNKMATEVPRQLMLQ